MPRGYTAAVVRRRGEARPTTATPPPVLLAKTRVTHYALLGRGVGFIERGQIFVGGTLLGKVPRLAISDDEGRHWLMHCGRTWNIRTVIPYASLAGAKEAAERRFPGSATRWIGTGFTKAQAECYLNRLWKGETCGFCGRRPDQIDRMFISRKRRTLRICNLCVAGFAAHPEVVRARR